MEVRLETFLGVTVSPNMGVWQGVAKVSPGLAMPDPSTPCWRATFGAYDSKCQRRTGSKGEEDSHRLPALRAATPKRPFQGVVACTV
jgi:hypothetical protein